MIGVFVDGLEFDTIIGLLDFERIEAQRIRIDMEFSADEFIDYAKVCEFTQSEFKKRKFYKIEDALEHFSIKFKESYPSLKSFYMKISKTQIIQNAIVGVKIRKNY